jgi:hypothetical protein
MLRSWVAVLAIIGMIATAGPTLAQTKGPNGGLVSGKGGHQTELVVGAGEITVYLLADGEAHGTKGVTLRAVAQQDGKTTTIKLTNQDGKKFVAKLPAPLSKGAIVVLTGKDDHGDAINARYVIQ